MKRMLLLPALMCLFHYSYSQSVTMTAGYADGANTLGTRVHVLANPCPEGTVFDTWKGNIQVEDPFSISTSFIMPSKNVKLTATYKPAPVWSPVETTINGSAVWYYFPAGQIKGLITFYHGSGGQASNWFLDEFSKLFINYAVEEGYAVFATESKNRDKKVWDMSGTGSIDVKNMSVMFTTLKNKGLITKNTPIFGVGMSDGSLFCSMIAALDNFSANALYCEPGSTKYIQTTNSPTEWCISDNDTTLMPHMMSQAQSNYELLKSRGIDAQFSIHYASPVFPTIFAQQQSFDSLESRKVYNDLVAHGMLNDRDFIIVNPMNVNSWQSCIDKSFSTKLGFIEGELTAAAAEHKFHNYFEHRTIMFFDKHLQMKSAVLNEPLPSGDNVLSIYPNPAKDYFNLQSTTIVSTIRLFNTLGKLVKQFSPNSATGQFPVGNLPNGIYLMQLTDENGKISAQKVLVNH